MMSVKEQRMFSMCLTESHKSTLLYQHGCIATRGGKIYKRGRNHHNTRNPLYMNNSCTCHAEVDVLQKVYIELHKKEKAHKLNKVFRRITLYVTRYNNLNSAPCIDCLTIIQKLNIKKIIFKLNDIYFIVKPSEYETSHMSYCQLKENALIT